MSIEKQLAKSIRDLPDSTLCDMALKFGFSVSLHKPKAKSKPKAKPAASSGATTPSADGVDHPKWKVLAHMQHTPKEGFAISQLATALEMKKSSVGNCIKKLKAEGTVFQGGERRFSRYATTQAAADTASLAAKGG